MDYGTRRPAAPSTTTEAPATSEEEELVEGAAPQDIIQARDGRIWATESYRDAAELIGPSSTKLVSVYAIDDGSRLVPYADDADGEV